MYMSKNMEFIVITWPESQKLMELEDFEEHSYLINSEDGIYNFGNSAYFVEKDWYDSKRT